MYKEKVTNMIDTELEVVLTRGAPDPSHVIFEEHNELVKNLKQDIDTCKVEQYNIRTQLETLQNESKAAGDIMRDYVSRINEENCDGNELSEKDMMANLQERIAVLQMEKDSVFQLWQISLQALNTLEEELKTLRVQHPDTKLYQEQIEHVRDTYADAIKVVETKLLQVKENFMKQQLLCESNKEKIDKLQKEKEEIAEKLMTVHKNSLEKDRSSQQTIENLKSELLRANTEINRVKQLKEHAEIKLNETKIYAANITARNEETKCKMSEAIELVEAAAREKDLVLQREALVLEGKARIEHRLSVISEEYAKKLEDEIKKLKDVHERDIKKYLTEIKEFKIELREKSIFLDRVEREHRLTQEELERVQQNLENTLHNSNIKLSELQQKLQQAEFELQVKDELSRNKYGFEVKELKEKISSLEEKLTLSNNALSRIQQHSTANIEKSIKYNTEGKDGCERYASLERSLIKTLDEKEHLAKEFRSLQFAFGQEIQKRDHETNLLQNKIRELELCLQKTTYSIEESLRNNLLIRQMEGLHEEIKKKHSSDLAEPKDMTQLLAVEQSKLQAKYDKKLKELTEHVKLHQNLNKKWSDEMKSLTSKFQQKAKELKAKINALRKENEELNRELLACRQQLVQYRVQVIHSYNQGKEIR